MDLQAANCTGGIWLKQIHNFPKKRKQTKRRKVVTSLKVTILKAFTYVAAKNYKRFSLAHVH